MTPIEVSAMRELDRWILKSPSPGYFRPAIGDGALVQKGQLIGELEVLGQNHPLIAPAVSGIATTTLEPRAVGYGDVLIELDMAASVAAGTVTASAKPEELHVHGLAFRAPTSGRYYGRPSPDKPPFLTVGQELRTGTTLCLLEVMKTFNRVTYSGAPARVTQLLVAEGADVTAGAPLLALEPIST